jgi:DNA-packaging protein gp3
MKHAGGRPTKYEPRFIDEVDAYLETTGKENMHIPKIESLAIWLDVSKDTLYAWGKEYPEFSYALGKIMKYQAQQLIDDGIYGGKEVNSTIVKLLLQNNHGMKERVDATTNDKDITPMITLDTHDSSETD